MGCGPVWVFEIGGSPLRMCALRRRGAGASEYYASVRVPGAAAPAVPVLVIVLVLWDCMRARLARRRLKLVIRSISDTSCCSGTYEDVH